MRHSTQNLCEQKLWLEKICIEERSLKHPLHLHDLLSLINTWLTTLFLDTFVIALYLFLSALCCSLLLTCALPYRAWRRPPLPLRTLLVVLEERIKFSDSTSAASSGSRRLPKSRLIFCSDLPLVFLCFWRCATCGHITPTTLVSAGAY